MSIPLFNEAGWLPPSLHNCTLEEVGQRFGSFQTSDQRPRLFTAFKQFVEEIQKAGIYQTILIDGSFVTGKPSPNDIDLVLVLPAGFSFRPDLSPQKYNMLSSRFIHRKFGFDVLVVQADREDYSAAVDFFQQVRNQPGQKKGLLRLSL